MEYKYFIEDADTGEWYRMVFHQHKSSYLGGTNKSPELSEYWTRNPNEAFGYFKDKQDAENFIKSALNKVPLRLEYMKVNSNEPRNLVVTEHEFVSSDGKN